MKNLFFFLSILISTTSISQPCSVSITILQNPSCTFCSDGVLQANPSGTPPFTYIWSPTAGTMQIADYLAVGPYWVCIQDSTGCQACDSITLNQSVGLQKLTSKSWIHFSPNPFTNDLTISVANNCSLTLFNVLGEAILEKSINVGDQILNTAFLSKGVYYINFQTETSSITTKVIKQ